MEGIFCEPHGMKRMFSETSKCIGSSTHACEENVEVSLETGVVGKRQKI
jgi:hypothetical protein